MSIARQLVNNLKDSDVSVQVAIWVLYELSNDSKEIALDVLCLTFNDGSKVLLDTTKRKGRYFLLCE